MNAMGWNVVAVTGTDLTRNCECNAKAEELEGTKGIIFFSCVISIRFQIC